MGLLADIQNDAVSDGTTVATMLRKCLLLAHQIDSELLEDWVRQELNGYPPDAEVPSYRRIPMHFKVTASNAAWSYKALPIAPLLINEMMKDDEFDIFRCRQAIGTINEGEIKDSTSLHVNLDNYALLLPGRVVDASYNVSRFWGDVPASQVLGITDAVRNRVLEFTLALQKKYPNADKVGGLGLGQQIVEKTVNQIFNTTINGGNAGVIGSASHSTVNVTVNQGNLTDLRQQLVQHGVTAEDAAALEAAIGSEPAIGEDKRFGPKVTSWVGGMLGKAASGAWGVGLAAGGALLEKALLGYYGY